MQLILKISKVITIPALIAVFFYFSGFKKSEFELPIKYLVADQDSSNYINYCAGCHGYYMEEFKNREWMYAKTDEEIFNIIIRLRDEGNTVLLVEQNAKAALGVADRGYVLETGRIILQGPSDELLSNREVQRAYLGRDLDSETKI